MYRVQHIINRYRVLTSFFVSFKLGKWFESIIHLYENRTVHRMMFGIKISMQCNIHAIYAFHLFEQPETSLPYSCMKCFLCYTLVCIACRFVDFCVFFFSVHYFYFCCFCRSCIVSIRVLRGSAFSILFESFASPLNHLFIFFLPSTKQIKLLLLFRQMITSKLNYFFFLRIFGICLASTLIPSLIAGEN